MKELSLLVKNGQPVTELASNGSCNSFQEFLSYHIPPDELEIGALHTQVDQVI